MLQYRSRVEVISSGLKGYVEARLFGSSKLLVSLARSEFSPEEWEKLSPKNGPTVTIEVEPDDLREIEGPAKIVNPFKPRAATWTDIVESAEKTMKKKPTVMNHGSGEAQRILENVRVGSKWRTKKGGYRYKIVAIRQDVAELHWIDGRDVRQTPIHQVQLRYELIEAAPENGEVDEAPPIDTTKFSGKKSSKPALVEIPSTVAIGSRWKAKKSGDRYEVIGVAPNGMVKLSWLDGKYTRDTTIEALYTRYDQDQEV